MVKKIFPFLRKVGGSLILPVSVLPISGLLFGLGSVDIQWIPPLISDLIRQVGYCVFVNIPLIFSIGIAHGLAKNTGLAALSAGIIYLVMIATLGVIAQALGNPTRPMLGIETMDTGVLGSIVVGSLAAYLANNFSQVKLPRYLEFFSGTHFVLLMTVPCGMMIGCIFSLIWPPIYTWIGHFSYWASHQNPELAFGIYGWVERLLLPFGLHHIWNAPFFFELGQYITPSGEIIRGEVPRFLAGDLSAGHLAGGYLFKMWGLPAAALAIWHSSHLMHRKWFGTLMLSAALTSFITGVTIPIEYSFLFVAPLLYAIHTVLAGFAFVICIFFDIRHSITFSHGIIDFALFYHLSHNAWMLLILGPIYAFLYYFSFRWTIHNFNLKTPGREPLEKTNEDKAFKSHFPN